MNNRMVVTLLILLSLLPATVPAQTFIQGRIVDTNIGEGVAYASISITNSTVGTATDKVGNFRLLIASESSGEKMKVSCIGYFNQYLAIDSLMQVRGKPVIIRLTPSTQYLQEVTVSGERLDPATLLQEAIRSIPQNYLQVPFNLEFYSITKVRDSTKTPYTLECLLQTYRKGYVPGATNNTKVLQKREHGLSPLRPERNKRTGNEYFPFPPSYNIFLIDQLSIDMDLYSIFNPKTFNKMNFASAGITVFDKDTVCIIEYTRRKNTAEKGGKNAGKYSGKIYIAINNLAIIRHTLRIGSSLPIDIIYKKNENHYFPYVIESERTWFEGQKKFVIAEQIFLQRIILKNIQVVDLHTEFHHPENIPYDKNFWTKFDP